MAATVKLPHITHPAHRRCSTDTEALQLRGSKLSDAEKTTTGAARKKFTRIRPTSVPTHLKLRPQSAELSSNQLIDVLANKLRGNGYFTIRSAFSAFDHEQRGFVTREALYRILCNILNGITRKQFTDILERLHLANRQTITFHDLYSKFRIMSSNRERTFLDQATHHGPKPLLASYVHSMLLARAEKCIHHLSDFLPQWKGLDGQMSQSEFKNILSYLSLPLNEEEFRKLWNRYDPKGKGVLTGTELMSELGVSISSSRPSTMSSVISAPCSPLSDTFEHLDADAEELIKEISKKLKDRSVQLLKAIKCQDPNTCGKVTSNQLLKALHTLDIPMTSEQCSNMLVHLGYPADSVIDYSSFIDYITSVAPYSITNTILTDREQQFIVPSPGRACISTADAESRLVCTLQQDFLRLLSRIKLCDPSGRGYIARNEFVELLKEIAPPSSHPAIQKLTNSLQDEETGLILYPKFLAMFDGPPAPKQRSPEMKHSSGQEASMVKVNETKERLSKITRSSPQQIMEIFEDLDPNNTERITKKTFQQMLFRLGLNVSQSVTDEVWAEVLKNKDGSVDPWQLIRQFGKGRKAGKQFRLLLSDDHMHMRSKFLHRDVDMLLKNLKMVLTTNQKQLSLYFRQYDPSGCGLIPQEMFVEAILGLSPLLSPQEVSHLTQIYADPSTNMINYHILFGNLPSSQPAPVYKAGNDIGLLLKQPSDQPLSLPQMHQRIATPPQYGLPGVKGRLCKQLQQRWPELRRQLMHMDPAGTGRICAKDFRHVLNQFGVSLGRDDMWFILEEFDSTLKGMIDYGTFLNVLLGQ